MCGIISDDVIIISIRLNSLFGFLFDISTSSVTILKTKFLSIGTKHFCQSILTSSISGDIGDDNVEMVSSVFF